MRAAHRTPFALSLLALAALGSAQHGVAYGVRGGAAFRYDDNAAVAVGADGAVYTGGVFTQPNGSQDWTVAKHDRWGNEVWRRYFSHTAAVPTTFNAAGWESPQALAVTEDGGVIVGGFFQETNSVRRAVFRKLNAATGASIRRTDTVISTDVRALLPAPGGGAFALVDSRSGADRYGNVVRITTSGALGWARSFGGAPFAIFGQDLRRDPASGDVLALFRTVANFDSPNEDPGSFVVRIAEAGQGASVLWQRPYDTGLADIPTQLAVADGRYAVLGRDGGGKVLAYVGTLPTGAVSWARVWDAGADTERDEPGAVAFGPSNSLLVASRTQKTDGTARLRFSRLDADGGDVATIQGDVSPWNSFVPAYLGVTPAGDATYVDAVRPTAMANARLGVFSVSTTGPLQVLGTEYVGLPGRTMTFANAFAAGPAGEIGVAGATTDSSSDSTDRASFLLLPKGVGDRTFSTPANTEIIVDGPDRLGAGYLPNSTRQLVEAPPLSQGNLWFSANGRFRFKPKPGFTGVVRFRWRAEGSAYVTGVQTAVITVG